LSTEKLCSMFPPRKTSEWRFVQISDGILIFASKLRKPTAYLVCSNIRLSRLNVANIPKVRTLCHQNSYLVRVSRVWNCLPVELRKPELSFQSFKSRAINYYMGCQTWQIKHSRDISYNYVVAHDIGYNWYNYSWYKI
jgi:hypothetical protein